MNRRWVGWFLFLLLLGMVGGPIQAQTSDTTSADELPFRLITILSNSRVSNIGTIVTNDRLVIRISGGPRWVDLNTLESRDLPADIIGIDPSGTQALAYDRNSESSYLIDLNSGERRGTLRTQIREHSFSPNSQLLITRSAFPVIDQVWDAVTGDLIGPLGIAADTASPPMPIFRPGSADIVTRSTAGEIALWNTTTRSERLTLAMSAPLGWRFLSDDQTLVTWNTERAALWNADSGELLSTLPISADERLVDVVISPDDARLIIHSLTLGVPQARRFRIWNIADTRSTVLISTYRQPVGSTRSEIAQIAISGDGQTAAAFSDQLATITLYDLVTGSLSQQVEMRSGSVTGAIFADGDRWLFTSDQYDQTVVWQRQGDLYIPVRTLPAGDLVLTTDAATLLINSFSSAYIYDLAERRSPEEYRVRGTILTPNLPVFNAPSAGAGIVGTLPTGNTPIIGQYEDFLYLAEYDGWVRIDPLAIRLQDNLPLIDVPFVRADGSLP